jgi:hypothetical protein
MGLSMPIRTNASYYTDNVVSDTPSEMQSESDPHNLAYVQPFNSDSENDNSEYSHPSMIFGVHIESSLQ